MFKLGLLRKYIRNTWEVLQCDVVEGWRRAGPIMWGINRYAVTRDILHTINRRKANRIGHILCRNCILKHVFKVKIDWRIEVARRRERGRNQLLDDVEEKRKYWKLKEEALDRTLWRTGFGRGYGHVRQTTGWMHYAMYINQRVSRIYM
jgi:hypothetical protein